MQPRGLLFVVDGAGRILRDLDRALVEPSTHLARPAAPLADLDTECRALARLGEQAAQAFAHMGELTAGAGDGSGARLTAALSALDDAAAALASNYERLRAEAGMGDENSALRSRLAEAARCRVVTVATGLAKVCDAGAALLMHVAAGGMHAEAEITVRSDTPDTFAELAAWAPPQHDGYDRAATQRALQDAERCRAALLSAPEPPAPALPLPVEPPARLSLSWALLAGAFGWWLGGS